MATNTKDFGGILQSVYQTPTQSLQVSIVGSGSPTFPNVVELSNGTDFLTTTDVGSSVALDVNIVNTPEMIISDTTDSIKIGNGSGIFVAVNPDGSLNVTSTISGGSSNVNLNGLAAFQTSQYSIGTSAVQITPTPLANRSSMSVKVITTTNNIVYIGNSPSVNTSNGYPLFNGDSIQLDLTGAHVFYAIATAAGQIAAALEIG